MQMSVTGTENDDLMKFAYQYDNGGNIRSIFDATQGVSGERIAYDYDHLDRLSRASASGENGYIRTYAYDEVGNIRRKGPLDPEERYFYEGKQPHAVTNVGNDEYVYDDNGNMAIRTENGTTYLQAWNAYNKLEHVDWEKSGVPCRTEFVYDGDGNRLLKVENMLSQFGESGNMERVTVYIGNIYERQFNTTGGPIGTRVEGVIPEDVDPITACKGAGDSPTDYGFTGQRNEGEFGLMDFNARMYSPRLGRFVSPDSIVPDPSSSSGFNRYRYARNSPLVFIDSTGHFEEDAIENYLIDTYGEEEAMKHLALIQANKRWWSILTTANGGDVLVATSDQINYVQFEGEGPTSLTGIVTLSNPWSDSYGVVDLMNLVNGSAGPPAVLAQFSEDGKLKDVKRYISTLENEGGTVEWWQEGAISFTLAVLISYGIDVVAPGSSGTMTFVNKSLGSATGFWSFTEYAGYQTDDERLRMNLIVDGRFGVQEMVSYYVR